MRLIDSHCHLNYEGLAERQDEVLANARARRHRLPQHLDPPARVERRHCRRRAQCRRLGDRRRPSARSRRPSRPRRCGLIDAASHPRVIAIGECGLDYYYDKSDRAAQRERFAAHIEAARTTGLPLVVHTRDAEEDTAEILGRAVRAGRGHRRPPLLHRQRRAGAQGARPRLLHLALRHRHLQERPRPAGNREDRPRRPAAGGDGFALPRPVPHRGQTCEPAFVADTAASWPS